MYLDAQEQIMSSVSKVIVDQKNGNSLLYLPLDKLMAASGANLPTAPASANAQPLPVAPAVPNVDANAEFRARDISRSRDRDSR
jgi:membrane protease subunit HflK